MAPPVTWTVSEVTAWLQGLGLPDSVIEEFKDNAVAGADLVGLSDEDLVTELQCKPLQARKIRAALAQLGVAGVPAGDSARVAPSPTAAPTAAPVPSPAPTAGTTAAAAAAPTQSAATPAAPPAAAAAQEPDPRARFEAADLQRYKQLHQTARELQGLQIATKVSQGQQHAASVRQRLDAAHQAAAAGRQAVAEAQKQYSKYASEGWYPGKALQSKEQKHQHLDTSQAALQQATQQLQQAEHNAAELGAQLAEAEKQLAAWKGKEAELSTAQRTLEQLVERMFAAPAWRASQRQNELADTTRALEGQAAEAGRGVGIYGRGRQLLTSASAHLQGALKALAGSQMLGVMGFGRGGIGQRPGLMGDMAEIAIFRQANDAVAQACTETEEAGRLLPGLPPVDRDMLSAGRAGLFQNILFGGMMSDMVQIAAVRKSMANVETMLGQVQAAGQWAQSNLAVYQHKEAQLRAQVAGKHGELQAFRSRALQAALAPAAAPAVAPVPMPSLI